ncbi:MAG: cytidylate kinase-like family protein [Treponema sp.]|nr:cytidylate kinase-like family protein [Treponema sp.]
MKKIITISREYCSGGHTIAELVSKTLGVPFYDRELIELASQQSGLSPEFIKSNEQKISSGLMYNLLLSSTCTVPNSTGMSGGISTKPTLPLPDQVFNAQRTVILELAKKGPCIIVGRCADFILKHSEDIAQNELMNVFVYAPFEERVSHCMERTGFDRSAAEKEIKKMDTYRTNHYSTFTEQNWGQRQNYDLLINSSLLGLEASARLIADIAKQAD